MAPSSRDRISVDLHGLKAALLDRAKAQGVSPSVWVRSALGQALQIPADAAPGEPSHIDQATWQPDRVRLSLRMTRLQAAQAAHAAKRAGMALGDYVADLVAGVPAVAQGGDRSQLLAGLVASSAQVSTLSRNIHQLTVLLRQANVEPARVYREMLDTLAADVRAHLVVAARLLADLQPQRRAGEPSSPNSV